jgi:hypothetical protein
MAQAAGGTWQSLRLNRVGRMKKAIHGAEAIFMAIEPQLSFRRISYRFTGIKHPGDE